MTLPDVSDPLTGGPVAIDRDGLVAFATTLTRTPSHRFAPGREAPVVTLVADRLRATGLQPVLAEVMVGRSNLFCTLVGREPGPHLMLCAHSDSRAPDEGDIELSLEVATDAGSVAGVGAASKGALAAMTVALTSLHASGALARGAVTLAVLIDREGEGLGAEDLVRSPVRADAAIVAEASGNRLCVGHPGVEFLEISFTAAASSAPGDGADAVTAAVRFAQALNETLVPSFSQNAHPRLGSPRLILRAIHGDHPSSRSSRCVVTLERVLMPDETFESVCDELADVIRRVEAGTPGVETRLRRVPGSRATLDHVPLLSDERAPVARAVAEAIRRVRGDAGKPDLLTGWSDAGMLTFYSGLPTAILGPGEPLDVLRRRETLSADALYEAGCLYATAALVFCGGIASGQGSLV